MLTLEIGLPRVAYFMIGVLPIFLAYTFVGMLFFGNYTEYFATFGSSCIVLFAVMNGDIVADSFNQV